MRYLVNRPSNLFGDFDRVLNNLFEDNKSIGQTVGRSNPSVDISESKDGYTLEVELPGLSEKDVDLKIEDNKLLISSITKENKEKEGKEEETHYLLKERGNYTFARSFILPKDANTEAVNASFSNGVLKINIEKIPEKQPRLIKIKAA